LSALSTQELSVFQEALDGAEMSVCYEELSENEAQSREWCEQCSWQMHWVALVISIVVTVVVFLIAVITLGVSTLVSSVVLVTVWAAVWTLVCILVLCDEDAHPCAQGQNPVCEGSFTFDENIPACTNCSFPTNAFEFGNCIFSPLLPGGGCPTGSTQLGLNCLWGCLDETPYLNSGCWQIGFTCQ